MKLKRETYRHIEAEIRNYYDTLQQIEELRRAIIEAGQIDYLGAYIQGGYKTSIVERRATRLADSLLLREMERITKAIRDTYRVAKEECRQVLYVKYGLAIGWHPPEGIKLAMENVNREDMRPEDMAEVCSMDRATFHRYRSGFIYGVAERLGWY